MLCWCFLLSIGFSYHMDRWNWWIYFWNLQQENAIIRMYCSGLFYIRNKGNANLLPDRSLVIDFGMRAIHLCFLRNRRDCLPAFYFVLMAMLVCIHCPWMGNFFVRISLPFVAVVQYKQTEKKRGLGTDGTGIIG